MGALGFHFTLRLGVFNLCCTFFFIGDSDLFQKLGELRPDIQITKVINVVQKVCSELWLYDLSLSRLSKSKHSTGYLISSFIWAVFGKQNMSLPSQG